MTKIIATIALFLLAACQPAGSGGAAAGEPSTAATPSSSSSSAPLPTVANAYGPEALEFGFLHGTPDIEPGGCLWLERPEGGRKISVLWPRGSSATYNPVQLLSADGTVIAREGEEVRLTGSPTTAEPEYRCMVSDEVFSAWNAEAGAVLE